MSWRTGYEKYKNLPPGRPDTHAKPWTASGLVHRSHRPDSSDHGQPPAAFPAVIHSTKHPGSPFGHPQLQRLAWGSCGCGGGPVAPAAGSRRRSRSSRAAAAGAGRGLSPGAGSRLCPGAGSPLVPGAGCALALPALGAAPARGCSASGCPPLWSPPCPR